MSNGVPSFRRNKSHNAAAPGEHGGTTVTMFAGITRWPWPAHVHMAPTRSS